MMLIEGLYTVNNLERIASEVNAKIKLNASHKIFKGHFPGNPIMPGVGMLQILKELMEEVLKKELFLQTATNIKFMAKINPDIHPNLLLTILFSEEEGSLKIKSTTYFEDTLALKLSAKYKIVK